MLPPRLGTYAAAGQKLPANDGKDLKRRELNPCGGNQRIGTLIDANPH
jgi:hypothetical protein